MSSSLNKVTLLGSLGADPEVKSLQNGGKVVNLRLATSESWKDKQTGEKKEKTEWHSVVIWNEGLAGVAERYLKKGSKVFIEGKLQTRKWQDQSGNDRYSTEIVLQGFDGNLILLGDPKGDGGQQRQGNGGGRQQQQRSDNWGSGGGGRGGFADDIDDDIPF